MYSLIAIIALIPLYFSHVFSPFGVIIGESSSFERQKVYLFFLLIIIALIEYGVRYMKGGIDQKNEGKVNSEKYIPILIGAIILLPWIAYMLSENTSDLSWILGGREKHHGYLFFISLIIYGYVLSRVSKQKLSLLLRTSTYIATLVGGIACIEYLFGSPFFPRIGEISWDIGRTISTLGNPNYVAGYLLIHLPLLVYFPLRIRTPMGVLIICGLITTGSYIGIGLSGILLTGYILRQCMSQKNMYLSIAGIVTLGSIGAYFLIPTDKILSLLSRFILMYDGLSHMVQYPINSIVGFGPESILTYYGEYRSSLIENYFPSHLAIDSLHNFWLDMAHVFGIPVACGIIAIVWKWITRGSDPALIWSGTLGTLFLGLNVMILSHLIVFLPVMIALGKSEKPSK